MGFTLRIMIEGLCVLFPDPGRSTTEIVFLHTGDTYENAHTCQLALRRGIVVSGDVQQPITLRKNDIFLSDGSIEITQTVKSAKHKFAAVPRLREVVEDLKPKAGVRRGTGSSDYVNARLQLHDGKFFEMNMTDEKYVIYNKRTGSKKGKAIRLAHCLVYERVIAADTAAIRIATASRFGDTIEIGPIGDYAEVVIGNYSHKETYLDRNGEGESAHFELVFEVFENSPVDKYGLKTASRRKAKKPSDDPARSIHVPCVGGCTTC